MYGGDEIVTNMNACRHGALRRVAAGIKGSLPDLADSIYQCIHRKDGRILDEASEKLGAIRAQRQVTPCCIVLTAHSGAILLKGPHASCFCTAQSDEPVPAPTFPMLMEIQRASSHQWRDGMSLHSMQVATSLCGH